MSYPIDCSDDAQDQRRQLLKDLMAKRFSGVDSLSDRGRSVNYVDGKEMDDLIKRLGNAIAMCEGSYRAPTQVIFIPYDKWL